MTVRRRRLHTLKATERVATYSISDFQDKDTISIKVVGCFHPPRLYIRNVGEASKLCLYRFPNLASGGNIPAAQYVYGITQPGSSCRWSSRHGHHHPTSQKLLKQAQRLKEFHEQHDGLRMTIVPADELYNEFLQRYPRCQCLPPLSADALAKGGDCGLVIPSNTPALSATAYWTTGCLRSGCRLLNPVDHYLLCLESDDSLSETTCYVSDSWLGNHRRRERGPIPREPKLQGCGGRTIPCDHGAGKSADTGGQDHQLQEERMPEAWQNTLMFMGDNGNENLHMADANEVADDIASLYPGYLIRKVMWDAYTRQTSSTGNSYPEVSSIIRQQQASGALVMDYAGHGSRPRFRMKTCSRLRISNRSETRICRCG